MHVCCRDGIHFFKSENLHRILESLPYIYDDKQCRIPILKLIDFSALDVCLLLVFNSEEEKGEALLAKKKALVSDISRLRERSENLMAKFPHLQFIYK